MKVIQPQYIVDTQGNRLAILPAERYDELIYSETNLKQVGEIPQWHKEILTKDLANLEQSILLNDESDNLSWSELEKEINQKYGY